MAAVTAVMEVAPAAAGRDQELLPHGGRVRRLSLFGGFGFADIHSRGSMPATDGRYAFDFGALYDLRSPLRLGLSFDHLSFRQLIPDPEGQAPPLEVSSEVSDLSLIARFDAHRKQLIPYALAGGGMYIAENGNRGNLLRAAGGVEVPLSWGMASVSVHLASYSNGAFLDSDPSGRQWSSALIFGFRLPLRRESSPGGAEELSRKDRARVIVRYIATPAEMAQLDSLTADAQIDAFMESFWERRDPYPEAPGNPVREEHLARLGAAASRFHEPGRQGWDTDRGRILIIYGEPHEVVREEHNVPHTGALSPQIPGDRGTAASYELWIYYRPLPRTDGQQSLFLFAEDLLGRYQLIWTNVSGEPGYARPLPPLPASLRGPIEASQ